MHALPIYGDICSLNLTFLNIFMVLMLEQGIGLKKLFGLSDAGHSDTNLIVMAFPFSSTPH